MDDPTEFDEGTLDSVPTIQGPNGLKVKIQPNGKTVSPFNAQAKLEDIMNGCANPQLTNLATPNWTGLIENDTMKQVAVDTLKEYGVGTCGPSGFYGTIGMSPLSFCWSHIPSNSIPRPRIIPIRVICACALSREREKCKVRLVGRSS